MDIIDAHSHFNTGTEADVPVSEIYQCNADDIAEGMRAAGILAGIFSSMPGVCHPVGVPGENDRTYAICKSHPGFYMWVILNPLEDETFEQAEAYLKTDVCVGIKIHPGYHGYSMRDHGKRIFDFAREHGAVVLTHPTDWDMIADLALEYPETKLIIAHLGGKEHVEAMKKAPNIWTDTSGGASLNNNVVEYSVQEVGYDRILFGTDTYACGAQRGRIEYARISDKAKEAIFSGNALRLLPGLSR